MKAKYIFLILLVVGGIFTGCGEDETPQGDTILNYDGDNQTAPDLPAGFYEFAIRFPAVIMRNVDGRSIDQISFYLFEAPEELFVTISPDNTPIQPGDIAYSQEITSPRTNGWNTITLDEPYLIDGNPLWIGIQVNTASQRQTVGCDSGPADPNGDWLYDENDQQWLTFRNRVGDDINWNIRVSVSN